MLGAGITTYVAVRVAIAEMKTEIKNNQKSIDRHRAELDWLRDKVTN